MRIFSRTPLIIDRFCDPNFFPYCIHKVKNLIKEILKEEKICRNFRKRDLKWNSSPLKITKFTCRKDAKSILLRFFLFFTIDYLLSKIVEAICNLVNFRYSKLTKIVFLRHHRQMKSLVCALSWVKTFVIIVCQVPCKTSWLVSF